MPDIEIIDSDSFPLCPHCDKELNKIERITKGFVEKHTVYICPHCRKILSIGLDREGWLPKSVSSNFSIKEVKREE